MSDCVCVQLIRCPVTGLRRLGVCAVDELVRLVRDADPTRFCSEKNSNEFKLSASAPSTSWCAAGCGRAGVFGVSARACVRACFVYLCVRVRVRACVRVRARVSAAVSPVLIRAPPLSLVISLSSALTVSFNY